MEDKVSVHNMYCKGINSGSTIFKHDEAFFNNVLGSFTNYEISRMIMNGDCDSNGKPLFDNIRVNLYETPVNEFENINVITTTINPFYVMVNINSK